MPKNAKRSAPAAVPDAVRATVARMGEARGYGPLTWRGRSGAFEGGPQVRVCHSLAGKFLRSLEGDAIVVHTGRSVRRRQEAGVEIFHVDEVRFPVVDHPDVPEHRLLGAQELLRVEQRYGKRDQFPGIPASDPVVRFHGWPAGSVVEVLGAFREVRECA